MATHSSILARRIPWMEEPCCIVYENAKSQTWLKWLSMHTKTQRGLDLGYKRTPHSKTRIFIFYSSWREPWWLCHTASNSTTKKVYSHGSQATWYQDPWFPSQGCGSWTTTLKLISLWEQETHAPLGLKFWGCMDPNILVLWRRKALLHRVLAFPSVSGSTLELKPLISRINGKGAMSMKSNRPAFKFQTHHLLMCCVITGDSCDRSDPRFLMCKYRIIIPTSELLWRFDWVIHGTQKHLIECLEYSNAGWALVVSEFERVFRNTRMNTKASKNTFTHSLL